MTITEELSRQNIKLTTGKISKKIPDKELERKKILESIQQLKEARESVTSQLTIQQKESPL